MMNMTVNFCLKGINWAAAR